MNLSKSFLSKIILLTVIILSIGSIPIVKINQSIANQSILKPLTLGTPVIDGNLSKNEYTNHFIDDTGFFEMYWKIVGENIFIAMIGKTTGWVGIGFDPGFIVKDADMIIGWVNDTGCFAFDAYATKTVGGFKTDISLGGTNDLIAWNGTQSSEKTIIEFERPLITNDTYDKKLDPNKNTTIIWAIGENNQDNMNTRPMKFGTTILQLGLVNQTIENNEKTVDINKIIRTVVIGSLVLMAIIGLLVVAIKKSL